MKKELKSAEASSGLIRRDGPGIIILFFVLLSFLSKCVAFDIVPSTIPSDSKLLYSCLVVSKDLRNDTGVEMESDEIALYEEYTFESLKIPASRAALRQKASLMIESRATPVPLLLRALAHHPFDSTEAALAMSDLLALDGRINDGFLSYLRGVYIFLNSPLKSAEFLSDAVEKDSNKIHYRRCRSLVCELSAAIFSLTPMTAEAELNYRRALSDIDYCLAIKTDEVNLLIRKARILNNLERKEETEKILAILDRLAPDDKEVLKIHSSLCEKNGDYEVAIEYLTKLISKYPYDPLSYVSRGNLYRKQKKYELALKDLEKSISLNPNDVTPYALRADLYTERKAKEDRRKAYADLQKVLTLNPDLHYRRVQAVVLAFELKRYDDIIKLTECVKTMKAEITEDLQLKAVFYLYRGLAFVNLQRKANACNCFYECGLIWLELGDKERALMSAELIQKIDICSPAGYRLMNKIYYGF